MSGYISLLILFLLDISLVQFYLYYFFPYYCMLVHFLSVPDPFDTFVEIVSPISLHDKISLILIPLNPRKNEISFFTLSYMMFLWFSFKEYHKHTHTFPKSKLQSHSSPAFWSSKGTQFPLSRAVYYQFSRSFLCAISLLWDEWPPITKFYLKITVP